MHPYLPLLGLDEVPEDVRRLFEHYEAHLGAVPPLLKIMARRPAFAHLYQALRDAEQMAGETIPIQDRLLLSSKLAALQHSPYAMQAALERNAMYGAYPASKIEAVMHNQSNPELFNEREQVLIELAQRVHTGMMDKLFFEKLSAMFSEGEILDLLLIACNQQWMASFARAVGLTSLDMIDLPEAGE